MKNVSEGGDEKMAVASMHLTKATNYVSRAGWYIRCYVDRVSSHLHCCPLITTCKHH